MKKRINLVCAIFMTLIVGLSGFFVVLMYQQEQVIKEQSRYITGLNEWLGESAKAYDGLLQEYQHSMWHYKEQGKWLYAVNQRMHDELINSELYEVEYEVVGEFGVVRSYRRIEPDSNIITWQVAIGILEYARDTHTSIVGDDVLLVRLNNAGFTSSLRDQEEWVRKYEDLIRYVKARR